MKGSPEVIDVLNNQLIERHSFFVQIFLFSVMCKKRGYNDIEDLFEFLSKEDFEVFSKITKRISFLDGSAFVDKLQESWTDITTVEEMLAVVLDSRLKNIAGLSEAIEVCVKFKDYASRNLMEKLLVEEDKHLAKVEAAMIQFSERGK